MSGGDPFDVLFGSGKRESADPFDLLLNPPRRSLPQRAKDAVVGMAENPWETVKGIAMAPIHAASTGIDFMGQTAAEMSLPEDTRANLLRTKDPALDEEYGKRISDREALFAAAQLATIPAARFLTPVARMLSPAAKGVEGVAASVLPSRAARWGTDAAFGIGAGVAYAPDDPALGALMGAAAGPVIHGVAKGARRIVRGGTPVEVPEVAPPPEVVPPPSPRVPSSLAEARLARAYKPQELDAPVSTGAARDRVAQLDAVLEPNRVKPTEAAPATTEAFPDGYSTPSTKVGRRPASAVEAPPADPFDVLVEPTPVVEPPVIKPTEPIPTIGEPVSFGRDLVRTGGKEPTFNTGTVFPGETASVGTVKPVEPPAPAGLRWRDETAPKKVEAPPVPSAEDAFLRDDAGSLSSVEGTGPTQVRGLSLGVEEKAVANKLTTSLGDLPEYQTISMADQATKASKLLADDAGLAHKIAMGEIAPPADLLPESVFVAVENRAIANGDVATLRSLASGRLTTEATTMGQRIRTLAERDPDSPVAAMQKIVDARTKGVKDAKGMTEASVQELQQHIAEAAKMDHPAWQTFIDSIRC